MVILKDRSPERKDGPEGTNASLEDESGEVDPEAKGFRSDPQLMEAILAYMPIGLVYGRIVTDEMGKPFDLVYLDMNHAYEAFLQKSKDEIIGKLVTETFPVLKDYLLRNIEPYARAALDGETVRFDRCWPITDKWHTITIYGPKRGYFVAVAEDISERRKIEDELKHSNDELRQFAYIASHDLQEPLRTMVGFMSLLERRYSSKLEPEGVEYIHSALSGGERMRELIDDLLEFSKADKSRKPGLVDMNEVAEKVLFNLRYILEENGGSVSVDPLPSILADSTQMYQVLQNLIGNAIKFHGKEPPSIHLSATPGHGEWIFAVRDNGIGFGMQYKDRIFQVFQKLHSKDDFEGTGIGLAIVKKIVEGHGGRVWAESEEGKGSTFYFTMPKVSRQ